MIHTYTGTTCASRSPKSMRKEPRPLSIIDEDPVDNITNWKLESENIIDYGVADVTTGIKEVKDSNTVKTNGINQSKRDCESKLLNRNAITPSDFEESSQTSTGDHDGNGNCLNALESDVTEKCWLSSANAPVETSSQESQVVPERKRSLRRLAVAPLEHPVFKLDTDNKSIENDNTVDDEASGTSGMKVVNTSSNKNGQKDEKIDVSCNENIANGSVWSNKDSNGPLGVRGLTSPETNGDCRPGSRQYGLNSNDENPTVLCSYVSDQFSDVSEGVSDKNCDMSEDEKQQSPTKVQNVFSKPSQRLGSKSIKMSSQIPVLSRNGNVSNLVKRYNGFTTKSKTLRQKSAAEPSLDSGKSKSNAGTSQPSSDNPLKEQLPEENDDKDNKETSIVEEPLDNEEMAWKNRVRQSFSFASLSSKSRPIRRSVTSFDFKNSPTDTHSGNRMTRKFSDTTGHVKFYVSEEHSGFYKEEDMDNQADDNTPGESTGLHRQFTSRNLAKQRQSSWQEIYNLRKKSLTMGVPLDNESRLAQSKNLEISRKISLGEISKSNTNGHTESNYGLSNGNSNGVTTQETNQSNSPSIRRISAIDQSDFRLLKDTATRLNLPTRRPSTMAWRAQYIDNQQFLANPLMFSNNNNTTTVNNNYSKDRYDDNGDDISTGGDVDINKTPIEDDEPLTVERKNRINESLLWLKQELINIRLQDQALARQFLGLRHTMNKLRLAAECEDHKDLIDTAEEEMEEVRELSRLVDIPMELLSPLPPLQHLGVTRMNLTSRRFSTC